VRIAFTIIHNGLHHLQHNNQYQRILQSVDRWVVVEGASRSNGSTRWCKEFPAHLHANGKSIDGTAEFLRELSANNSKLIYVESDGFWNSKDDQVNRAVEEVRKLTHSCWLWQIDIDEQWTESSMSDAESELEASGQIAGTFRADCRIGNRLRAVGEWGEARTFGYIRLWKWSGQKFICHEPPIIEGQMGIDPKMLSQTFTHYNYYFEQDVAFKDAWYGGHEQILDRWKLINSLHERFFPMHISTFITGEWGKTNSSIIYCKD